MGDKKQAYKNMYAVSAGDDTVSLGGGLSRIEWQFTHEINGRGKIKFHAGREDIEFGLT